MFHRRLRLKQQFGKQGLERRKNSKKCRFLYSVDFCKNVDFEVFFSVSSSQGSLCLVYLTNQVRSLPFSQVLGMLWHPSHFRVYCITVMLYLHFMYISVNPPPAPRRPPLRPFQPPKRVTHERRFLTTVSLRSKSLRALTEFHIHFTTTAFLILMHFIECPCKVVV